MWDNIKDQTIGPDLVNRLRSLNFSLIYADHARSNPYYKAYIKCYKMPQRITVKKKNWVRIMSRKNKGRSGLFLAIMNRFMALKTVDMINIVNFTKSNMLQQLITLNRECSNHFYNFISIRMPMQCNYSIR